MGREAMLSGWRAQGHLGITPSAGSEPGYVRGVPCPGPEMRLEIPRVTVERIRASGLRWDWHSRGEVTFLQRESLLGTTQRLGRLRQRERLGSGEVMEEGRCCFFRGCQCLASWNQTKLRPPRVRAFKSLRFH